MTNRHLISDDQIIVVLDTSPVRNLAYLSSPNFVPPKWVETFADMARNGYSFSLADATAAELLAQIRSGRIHQAGYDRMISHLKSFLNPNFPVLPGKIDIAAMLGVVDEPHRLDEISHISQAAWCNLLHPHSVTCHLGPPIEQILEDEREDWIAFIRETAAHSKYFGLDLVKSDPDDAAEFLAQFTGGKIYPDADIDPPMAERMHLELRYLYRQVARSVQMGRTYDPASKNNKNDGIDADIYKYLMLPAFVVAEDKGFFSSLNTINSFQREWFMRPESLAKLWLDGRRPQPIWSTDTDDA